MTERAAIGTLWRLRRDKTTWRIRQSWRKERRAQLESIDAAAYERRSVTHDELRRFYEEIA